MIEILRSTGLTINNKDEVSSLIGSTLDAISTEGHRKHGMRTESMFAYMAGALGNCSLIKQEDGSGICLVANDKIKIPDYRIILKNNEIFFVEVKNCSDKKIVFKKDYIEGLKEYASINKNSLKIAIYWRKINMWSLISPDWFIFKNRKCELRIGETLAKSEMALLDDRMIATKAPLSLRLLADESKTSSFDSNGRCLFTVGDVQMFSAGNQIIDQVEKNMAFQFMLYSSWSEQERFEIVNDKIAYIEYLYTPEEIDEEQGFNMLGNISSIISNKFNSSTVSENEVERLAPQGDPEKFEVFIPEDYKGIVLPLWQFILQPNMNYGSG